MFSSPSVLHTGIGRVEWGEVLIRPPAAGEVLIETICSAVSPGTELRCLANRQAGQASFPFIPGYAMLGRVLEAGADRQDLLGRRVIASGTRVADGANVQWGAHVGHAVVDAGSVVAVPDDVPDDEAVLARLLAIPRHGWTLVQPEPHQVVAVVGLGIIGLGSAMVYSATGSAVVGVDVSARRVEQTIGCGINAVVAKDGVEAAIRQRFPEGVDVIVDATGVPAVLAEAVKAFRLVPWDESDLPVMRYVVQGSYTDQVSIPYRPAFQSQIRFIFSRDRQQRDVAEVLRMLSQGTLDVSKLPRLDRPAQDAASVYAELAKKDAEALTAVLRWR